MKRILLFFGLIFSLNGFAQTYPQANSLVTIAEENFGKITPNQSNLYFIWNAQGGSFWRLRPNDRTSAASSTIRIHPGGSRFERLNVTGASNVGGTTPGVSSITLSQISDFNTVWPPKFSDIQQRPSVYPSDWLTTANRPEMLTNISTYLNQKAPNTRAITAGTGLTGGGDLSVDRSFSVVPNSTVQKTEIYNAGSIVGTRKATNFTSSGTAALTITDDPSNDRVNINISATGGSGGMAEPSTNGMVVRDGAGTSVARTITGNTGISITNGNGVSGNPTIAPANDLLALENLATTGFPKRTATDTWSMGAVDLGTSDVTGTLAAGRMPALTGDITSSAGGTATTYNSIVPANKGGAGAISGLLKANGSGTVSAAIANTDYLTPTGSAAALTNFPTLNQNTTGTASNITGTAAIANGGTGATTAANARTNLGLVIGTDVAPVASPALTGTPTAPTATAGTNTTQIATTAFTQSAILPKLSHKTIAEVRAFTAADVTNNPRVWITDAGKEGEFRYVAGSSNSDNTGTVLVTTTGSYRYERVYQGAIRASWFEISGDSHTGQSIARAVNVAIAKLSTTVSETVIIKAGTNTINNDSIIVAPPVNKKITLLGEVGNVIDFYYPNYDSGIFSNGVSWTFADTTYTHGTIELNGLNFLGNRNPTASYLSSDTGVMGFWLHNMQRVEVRNCTFSTWYGSGGFIAASGGGVIENNVYNDVYARQNTEIDARGDAITILAYSRNFIVRNNSITLSQGKTGRGGITVDDKCRNVIVDANIIQGYERGIHVEGSQDITITKNQVRRSPIAGYSSFNKNVLWEGNTFDGANRVCNPVLTYSAVFWAYQDTTCTYRGNIVKNWHSLSNTYLAKFWGMDLLIDGNTFQPNAASADVYGYGAYTRNRWIGNRIEGKANLMLDLTTNNLIQNNELWGGYIAAQNSTDNRIIGNILRPGVGDNIGQGIILYGATRPYCARNTIVNATSYCFENSATTDAIFEENTYERTHSSAAAYSYFYVSTGISATGVKKTSADRYNVVNDYNNNNKYYIGNTGTPTAY